MAALSATRGFPSKREGTRFEGPSEVWRQPVGRREGGGISVAPPSIASQSRTFRKRKGVNVSLPTMRHGELLRDTTTDGGRHPRHGRASASGSHEARTVGLGAVTRFESAPSASSFGGISRDGRDRTPFVLASPRGGASRLTGGAWRRSHSRRRRQRCSGGDGQGNGRASCSGAPACLFPHRHAGGAHSLTGEKTSHDRARGLSPAQNGRRGVPIRIAGRVPRVGTVRVRRGLAATLIIGTPDPDRHLAPARNNGSGFGARLPGRGTADRPDVFQGRGSGG